MELEELKRQIVRLKNSSYKVSIQLVERVLKGWQEESSEGGSERRSWRWMVEAEEAMPEATPCIPRCRATASRLAVRPDL